MISGTVVAGEIVPIMILICGFCRGDEEESFYSDGSLKNGMWWSRSNHEGGCFDFLDLWFSQKGKNFLV